jgi:hypothetical protein
MSDPQRQITLKPSHLSLFWWYLLGVLMIPVFGIGIYLIYRFYSAHSSISYVITDQKITFQDSKISQNIDLANITDTEVFSTFNDRLFSIGNITIQTRARKVTIIGQKDPEQLADLIRQAAESERRRLVEKPSNKSTETPDNPGTLDKRDYLTGLWQQGLLSDEDYKKEVKHFR